MALGMIQTQVPVAQIRGGNNNRRTSLWTWLHQMLAPAALGPYARYTGFSSKAIMDATANAGKACKGAWVLLGDPFAVEQAVAGISTFAPGTHLVTIELAGTSAPHSEAFLVGSSPGYRDYDLPMHGSPVAVKLNAAIAAAGTQGCVVVVMRNIHKAHPNVQTLLATLATSGRLTLASGETLISPNIIVIASAGGVWLPGRPFDEDCPQEMVTGIQGVRHWEKERTFTAEIIESFKFHQFRVPGPRDMMDCAMFRLASEIQVKMNTDLFAVPVTCDQTFAREFFSEVRFTPEDASWKQVCAKVEAAVGPYTNKIRDLIAAIPDYKIIPQSVLSLENGQIEVRSEDGPEGLAIPEPFGSASVVLPAAFVERSNFCPVPSSAYWGMPANLYRDMKAIVFGQEKSLEDLCTRFAAALVSTARVSPIVSSLVVGPTGTGKTATATAFALSTGKQLVTCDCGSWKTEAALIEGLFGDTDNSVTTLISRRPDSVLLLDEADKAHPRLWDMIMGALDHGTLRDVNGGRAINLRHAVVFLTSNYLADELATLSQSIRDESVHVIDSTLRTVLAKGADINTACLERLDAIYLMMPLVGKETVPMWRKFVEEGVAFGSTKVSAATDAALELIELLYSSEGGGDGARARKRILPKLVRTAKEQGALFKENKRVLCLSAAGVDFLVDNPMPTFPRQRFWGHGEAAKTVFLEKYRGNRWQAEKVFETIAIGAAKPKPRGPVGVIMLCGPTGSGKTFMGETIAAAFDKGATVRIDCGQYIDASLINGALFGIAGDRPGCLTRPLTMKQDRVIIFDEFTRAASSFIDQVMTVLDEGRATDMFTGLPVDIRQSLILMTTNECADVAETLCRDGVDFEETHAQLRDSLIERGVLQTPHAKRISLFLPLARIQSSGDSAEFFLSNLRTAADEFGLPHKIANDLLAEAMATLPGQSDAREIHRWADGKMARTTLSTIAAFPGKCGSF